MLRFVVTMVIGAMVVFAEFYVFLRGCLGSGRSKEMQRQKEIEAHRLAQLQEKIGNRICTALSGYASIDPKHIHISSQDDTLSGYFIVLSLNKDTPAEGYPSAQITVNLKSSIPQKGDIRVVLGSGIEKEYLYFDRSEESIMATVDQSVQVMVNWVCK